MRMQSTRALAVAALVALLTAGCATSAPPARVPEQVLQDAAFAPPREAVDPAAAFALSPAMRHYLDVEIAPLLRREGRQRGLVEALYSRAHLQLEYDAGHTRTAAEAFDARAGNCLSLVVMTAALARHLDLPIQFQALTGQESWSRSGALSIINGHVNIAIGRRLIDRVQGTDADTMLRLEFGSLPLGRGAALRVVSEAAILAMFMNNRAAESLVRGDADTAYAYAREAVLQDPSFAGGYNTLGVLYRQRGLDGPAARAFVHALALEPEHRAALDNLARLYESQGRLADAAPLRATLARVEREPPFLHFDRAREAIAHGDYAAARDHLQRELRRDPDYHEFHYWMAVALAGLGDAPGAARHLARARDNSTTRGEQSLYAGKLARLKAHEPQVH